jgi:hypothetical protein
MVDVKLLYKKFRNSDVVGTLVVKIYACAFPY